MCKACGFGTCQDAKEWCIKMAWTSQDKTALVIFISVVVVLASAIFAAASCNENTKHDKCVESCSPVLGSILDSSASNYAPGVCHCATEDGWERSLIGALIER